LVEVLNVQSQLAQDRTQLPQLKQQLAEARNMLAVLLGISPADLGPTDFTLDSSRSLRSCFTSGPTSFRPKRTCTRPRPVWAWRQPGFTPTSPWARR
jgi:hypothetical protein